jgi:hypothetical protein
LNGRFLLLPARELGAVGIGIPSVHRDEGLQAGGGWMGELSSCGLNRVDPVQCGEEGGLSSGGDGGTAAAAAVASLGSEERAILGSRSWYGVRAQLHAKRLRLSRGFCGAALLEPNRLASSSGSNQQLPFF